jgi:hypothetical protein
MKQKTLRQLRRALRAQATELETLRKETLDAGLEDHWRWKAWVNHGPAVVHRFLAAADVIDEIIKSGGFVSAGWAVKLQSRKRRKKPAGVRRIAGQHHLRLVVDNTVQ